MDHCCRPEEEASLLHARAPRDYPSTPAPPATTTTTTPSPRSSTCGKSLRAPRGRERAPDERGWRDQRVRVSTSICPLLPQLDQRANCPLIDGDSFAINLPSKTPTTPTPRPAGAHGQVPISCTAQGDFFINVIENIRARSTKRLAGFCARKSV